MWCNKKKNDDMSINLLWNMQMSIDKKTIKNHHHIYSMSHLFMLFESTICISGLTINY